MIHKINNKNDKIMVHEKDLLHKSAHLLIVKDLGEILCRKRSDEEERYAGLWTSTYGTHVIGEDDYLQTLQKGFDIIDPSWIGEFKVKDEFENEINGLYISKHTPNIISEDRKFVNVLDLKLKEMTPHLHEAYKLFVDYMK
tara:strand:+ start:134 stop:556 length:423 start_codon:yes stop_codon:yes gene_type:complete